MDWSRCNNLVEGDNENLNVRETVLRVLCNRLPNGRFTYISINLDEDPEDWSCAYNEELLKTYHDEFGQVLVRSCAVV